MRSRKPKGTFPFVFSTLCLFSLLAFSNPAYAGQAEARATALDNNCTPKKIEIYQQSIGAAGQTIWRVTCNLPKSVSQSKDSVAPDALMISCDQSLCDVMNPVQSEKK